MELFDRIIIPDVTIYLVGILALLALWQYHQNQVLAGRIYAVDFWDVSGIRMFMHVATMDNRACPSCREAHGTVFLPSLATKRNFSTLQRACSSSRGCRCMIVGLYGGWPEASELVQHLRKSSRKKPMRLGYKDVQKVFEGPWQRSVSGAGDRLTIHMVEALQLEGSDHEAAIVRYRYVVEQAKGARDLYLLVPAYLRLVDLLERIGRLEEALEVIEHFEHRFAKRKAIFYYPNETQRGAMSIMKSRMVAEKVRLAKTKPAAAAIAC
jgi:hypothetical protein